MNLIGEHTDYNGGEVLPIAIGQRTWVAARRVAGTTSLARSQGQPDAGTWDMAVPARAGAWWDYLSGIQAALQARGATIGAVQIAVAGDVPVGAGLGSSAALEIAAATALAGLISVHLDPRVAALLSQRVESGYVGVACGLMDQFASALAREGSALHIWCDTGRTEQVPMKDAVLIFDTGTSRQLRRSEFNARRAECEEALRLLRLGDRSLATLAAVSHDQLADARLPAALERRARHVVDESRRVRRAVHGLRAHGALPGELLFQSHESLRTLYECSTAELDWFVERAAAVPGIRGARLTGAGWGGCAIAVGDERALTGAAPAIAADFRQRFGIQPRVWLTHAETGACLESEDGEGSDRRRRVAADAVDDADGPGFAP